MQQPRYNCLDLIKPLAIVVGVSLTVGLVAGLVIHAKVGAPKTEMRVNS